MSRCFVMLLASFAMMLTLAAPAGAASDQSSPSADKPFVVRALVGGQTQVQAGKLASGRASDSVKAYAKRLIDQRAPADEALQKLADERGIRLPQESPLARKSLLEKLTKLDGKAFDRTFLRAMVDIQESDVALFKRQLDYGADEKIKDFAKENLPAIEAHLKSGRELLKSAADSTTQSTQPARHDEPTMMK
jgi:putative membrane protein